MVGRCALWLLSLCAWLCMAPVQATVVDIGQSVEWREQLGHQVQVYRDASGSMDAASVARVPDGSEGANQTEGFVYISQLSEPGKLTRMPWWTKVQLINTSHSPRRVRLILNPGVFFHTADFYIERNGRWISARQAQDATEDDGPGMARYHSSAISLPANESTTVLIRTTGVAPSQLRPYLYTDARFNDYLAHSGIWDGLLLGGLLALAWGAWALGLFSRSKTFLLLGTLSFSTMLVEALRRGYDKLFFDAGVAEWGARAPLVMGALTVLLFVLFILQIAATANVRLPLRRLMSAWAMFYVGIAVLASFGDVHHAIWLNEHVRPFFSVCLLFIAIVFIRRNAPTRKLMLVFAVYSVLRAGLLAMESGGILPDYINSLSIGVLRLNPVVALSSFFLNLSLLAAWVAYVGQQRKKATEKIAALQREENQRLEQEVARQTAALSQALQYADEKNRQQTQIVGYVSHDLRAPLATIAGYTKLLEQTASKEQEVPLNAITRSVDYQMTLIGDILGYAAAELKPLSLQPESVPFGEYLDEMTQHATALSRQQNNRFAIKVSNPVPKHLWIDGRRLRQVLLNLLSNAAKFTRGGNIGLSIAASPVDTGWRLRFVVSDSGIGIEEHKKDRVFKEFRQLDTNSGGVGLGLYIAQSILRSMGAELHLDSSLGQGAAFSFEIDVAAVDNDVIIWTAPATLPGRKIEDQRLADPIPSSPEPSPRDADALSGPIPPAHERSKLAIMAQGGHLTDIESWLQAAIALYPACAAYFHRVHEALSRLDLDTVERLALAQSGAHRDL